MGEIDFISAGKYRDALHRKRSEMSAHEWRHTLALSYHTYAPGFPSQNSLLLRVRVCELVMVSVLILIMNFLILEVC